MVHINNEDQFLIINAVRYARGSATYIVAQTCRWVINHWGELTPHTKSVLAEDVALELELRRDPTVTQSLITSVDTPEWEKLLGHIERNQP